MIRVLVTGDIRLFREGLALHLAAQPGVAVVASAASHAELLEQMPLSQPDVLLIDMAMPESLQILRDVAKAASATRVVALSVPELEPAVLACAEAGIDGYVTRDGSLDDVVIAVHRAARGESVLPPSVAGRLLRRLSALAARGADSPDGESLTARELEIARLVDRGLSNKHIAAQLCIELSTVKNHMHRILTKLHAQHRAEIPRRLHTARVRADDGWAALRR
jgi:DNA-binding NarL/FixJ family response regulator